jgi:hypothetical protein
LKALTARSVAALTEYLQGLDIVLGDNATITEIAREPDQWEICGASSSVLHEVRLLIDPKPELTTAGGKALEPDYFATWTMALRQGRGDLLKQAFQKIEITLPEVFSVREKQSKPAVWRIQDPTGLDMTAWTRVYDLGLAAIYVQTAGTLVRAAFTRNRRILARKAFIEKRDSEWTVDNDLGNPASLAQEYVAHRIVPEGAGCAVFGSSFRINRLAGNNRTEAALLLCCRPQD